MNILAFDYGQRRIGVAVGEATLSTARGIDVVRVAKGRPDSEKIKKIVQDWQPENFVVGIPLTKLKTDSTINKDIRRFGNWLESTFELPVHYVDERLSTEESNYRMHAQGVRLSPAKKTELRNKLSAQIILETYFSTLNQLQAQS